MDEDYEWLRRRYVLLLDDFMTQEQLKEFSHRIPANLTVGDDQFFHVEGRSDGVKLEPERLCVADPFFQASESVQEAPVVFDSHFELSETEPAFEE